MTTSSIAGGVVMISPWVLGAIRASRLPFIDGPERGRIPLDPALGDTAHDSESAYRFGQIRELLINSLSTFLVLFRAALRLYQDQIPAKKIEALQELSRHIQFDTDVFKRVAEMKEKKAVKGTSPETLFKAYLEAVETVVDSVDSFLHKKD